MQLQQSILVIYVLASPPHHTDLELTFYKTFPFSQFPHIVQPSRSPEKEGQDEPRAKTTRTNFYRNIKLSIRQKNWHKQTIEIEIRLQGI